MMDVSTWKNRDMKEEEERKEGEGQTSKGRSLGYPHRPDHPRPVQRTHRGRPTLGRCKDWVLQRVEGEFGRSALGECSRSREGARVETANVRQDSSVLEKGENVAYLSSPVRFSCCPSRGALKEKRVSATILSEQRMR